MTQPEIWIGTSWKMNKTRAEARAFSTALAASEPARDPRIQRFVIPPFTALGTVSEDLAGSSVKLGAQNMHWADHGAWTGEISAPMLHDFGVQIVELGHSERRKHFGETDATVGLKTEAAMRHGLIPLICIGETREERDSGRAQEVLHSQIQGAFAHLTQGQKSAPVLLAYEPVWAIGEQGVPASAAYANARHAEIIAQAEAILGQRPPCLYGGSVTARNCEELIQCPHIDGLFIGRAAWDVAGYLDILAKCARTL